MVLTKTTFDFQRSTTLWRLCPAKILIAINFKSGGGGTRPFADMADNTLFFKGTL